jgi:polar amino acid transport system ATP-binding protein
MVVADRRSKNEAAISPVIELQRLSLSYGAVPVLAGIDLVVPAGEKLVVIGPSGSGKSTLLRCVNGLARPDRGEIRVFGETLGRPSTRIAARRRMGMIFQQFNLYSMRTVLENVMLAPVSALGMPRGDAETLARASLARVEVGELAHKFPFQISGGQQQRVAIARALAMRPEILLLDEPTSALDPELIQSVLDLILSLAEDGMTILCVTHEIDFARRLADRVLFMVDGRIAEEGAPASMLRAPRTDRLRAFLASLAHGGAERSPDRP